MSKHRVKVTFEVEVSGAESVDDAARYLNSAALQLPYGYGTIRCVNGWHVSNGVSMIHIGRTIGVTKDDQHS